jgi:hypothetical protein
LTLSAKTTKAAQLDGFQTKRACNHPIAKQGDSLQIGRAAKSVPESRVVPNDKKLASARLTITALLSFLRERQIRVMNDVSV